MYVHLCLLTYAEVIYISFKCDLQNMLILGHSWEIMQITTQYSYQGLALLIRINGYCIENTK